MEALAYYDGKIGTPDCINMKVDAYSVFKSNSL